MTTTTAIKIGDEVRVTRDVAADEHWEALRKGSTFTVEDYVSAAESEDGEPFYWLSTDYGTNSAWAPADAIEVTRSAETLAARKMPTIAELAKDLAGVIGDFSDHDVDESARDGEDAVEFYGTTPEGLKFGFRVRVESVWHTDI